MELISSIWMTSNGIIPKHLPFSFWWVVLFPVHEIKSVIIVTLKTKCVLLAIAPGYKSTKIIFQIPKWNKIYFSSVINDTLVTLKKKKKTPLSYTLTTGIHKWSLIKLESIYYIFCWLIDWFSCEWIKTSWIWAFFKTIFPRQCNCNCDRQWF